MTTRGEDLLDIFKMPEPGPYALPRTALAELAGRLEHLRPRAVLELGSGESSRIIHAYAARHGATALTLESEHRYLTKTGLNVVRHTPISSRQVIVHAPLISTSRPDGAKMYSLDAIPQELRGVKWDFVLIDGPRLADGGRAATLPTLMPMLHPQCEVWLDDATRPSERAAIREWTQSMPALKVDNLPIGHGVAVLRTHQDEPRPVDASGVVLTLLTGQRPNLTASTLHALHKRAPGMLETATVIALNNGNCSATADVLREYDDMIELAVSTDSVVSIGDALAALTSLLLNYTDDDYWIHLEDDWTLASLTPGWLDRARGILSDRCDIGQVRLRAACEPTRGAHMVTDRALCWELDTDDTMIAESHITLNPSLMRRELASLITPCIGEGHAQRKAYAAGVRRAAQLLPGAFIHAGEGRSLRIEMGSPA